MSARLARALSKVSGLLGPDEILLPLFALKRGSRARLRVHPPSATLARVKDHACDEYIKTLPRKRVAAGVLLRDANRRVVLIEPSYKRNWEIPGGVVEADESPWSAAERELEEELGLVRRNMPVLVVDYVPGAPDGMPEGLLWIFDGGVLSAAECDALRGHDDEVKSVQILSMADAVQKTKESLALRLQVALDAALAAETFYCERGVRRPLTEPLSV